MPLSIIKGHYRIQGSEPDGDSVHFHPTNPDAFNTLHLPARVSSQGGAQLRPEAIDALETHYSPRVPGGFLAFLATRDDRLFVLSEAHATGLDIITRVDGQTVRLPHPPDDLIFIEA